MLAILHWIIIAGIPMCREWKNNVQFQAYYLNEANREMFSNVHISLWNGMLCRRIYLHFCCVVLVAVHFYHSFLFWSLMEMARDAKTKVSFWLSLQKFWMNEWKRHTELSTQWNAYESVKGNHPESAMRDEIELHVFCSIFISRQNVISYRLLHYNQFFFSYSINFAAMLPLALLFSIAFCFICNCTCIDVLHLNGRKLELMCVCECVHWKQ